MQRKIIRVAVSFLALVPFLLPGLAVAAPQTLGFVATNGPVELKCEAGHCKTEFSSFCLQEEHSPPTKGTPYFAMHTRSIQVTASRSDGRQISLSPAMDFTVTASRGYVAVLRSIRPEVVRDKNITGAHVTIGEHITLKPAEVAGDPNPQSEADLKLSAGTLRQAGTKLVDSHTDRMSAALVT